MICADSGESLALLVERTRTADSRRAVFPRMGNSQPARGTNSGGSHWTRSLKPGAFEFDEPAFRRCKRGPTQRLQAVSLLIGSLGKFLR